MKKKKKGLLSGFVALAMVLSLLIPSAMTKTSAVSAATSSILPRASNNLNVSLRSTSELVAVSSGYMRVYYDGEAIGVEYYDSSFNITSRQSIAMELSIWGGFYAGSDAYYLVEGQNNTAEDDSAEVIRVIKYSTSWKRLGAAKITRNSSTSDGEVRYPFKSGCVEFTEAGGYLYIVTGHEGYVDASVGQGHQGLLVIQVDESSMTGEVIMEDFWHSFAQYIDTDGSYLYLAEKSEGSLCTSLKKIDASTLKTTSSTSVLDYGGSNASSSWAIATYVSLDGIALSSSNVLCVGTSIDQSTYDSVNSSTSHNIYLTVTSKSNVSTSGTTVKWLTNYSGDGKSFVGLNITKVNNNRFMISWEEYNTKGTADTDDTLSGHVLHYIFVDGSGNALTKEFTAAASISDCRPILSGSKIVYYASTATMVDFYTIDSSTGAFSKKIYRVAGDNATWKINDGVLTISGSGAISDDISTSVFQSPLSNCSGLSYISSDYDGWGEIRDSVKSIVIEDGITSIPAETFTLFNNLTTVTIGSGVKEIGNQAFIYNDALTKITIPTSVTSIGEDILWTGSYWVSDKSKVTKATIYCYSGSTAHSYAVENNIKYSLISSGFDFTILGGSVRVSEPYGIRFGIRLGKTGDYGNVTIVEYGTLIIPTEKLGSSELTTSTSNVLKIKGTNIYSETSSALVYTGVLINIPTSYFDTEISGRGYLIYKDTNGTQHTIYTDTVSRTFNGVTQSAYDSYVNIANPTSEQKAILNKLKNLLNQ